VSAAIGRQSGQLIAPLGRLTRVSKRCARASFVFGELRSELACESRRSAPRIDAIRCRFHEARARIHETRAGNGVIPARAGSTGAGVAPMDEALEVRGARFRSALVCVEMTRGRIERARPFRAIGRKLFCLRSRPSKFDGGFLY
jgi:hypothetical protein